MTSHDARSSPTAIRLTIGVALAAAFTLAYYRLIGGAQPAFILALDHCATPFCDFVNHYYPMGRGITAGAQPVDGFYYSAFFALLLEPFGRLPLPDAVSAWAALQATSTLLLAVVSLRAFFRPAPGLFAIGVALFATSFPILHNFKWGQVSTPITLAVLASLWLHRRGRPVLAGVALAFATSVKYYAAIFVVYYVLRRHWRELVAFAAGTVALFAVYPAAVLGARDAIAFQMQATGALVRAAPFIARDVNSQYFVNVALRLLPAPAGSNVRGLMIAIGYIVSAAGIWVVWHLRRDQSVRAAVWSVVVLFLVLPFLLETSWPHYFVYLPFCQAALWCTCEDIPSQTARNLVRAGVVASVTLSSVLAFALFSSREAYASSGVLLAADVVLLAAVWSALALRYRS